MGVIADSIRRDDWERVTQRVEGWGIYDSIHPTRVVEEILGVDGKKLRKEVWVCPVYRDWKKMLYRALNKNNHKAHPSYIGTTVESSWSSFCNFYEWVMTQPNKDWMNCELDKDFLSGENKHYGPSTCVYIPKSLNNFILDNNKSRGKCLLGVSLKKGRKIMKYRARCSNPFTKEYVLIGHYSNEIDAHLAYKAYKHELALKYIELGLDSRIEDILLTRYSTNSDLTGV